MTPGERRRMIARYAAEERRRSGWCRDDGYELILRPDWSVLTILPTWGDPDAEPWIV